MKHKIILAGFGGQGIMLSGMLITYAGMIDQYEVSWLPSYGPEMRGGTANCHVIISSDPISSPVVNTANSIIIMNKPSLDKFVDQVKTGGNLFINSSLIDEDISRTDISVYRIPVIKIAAETGSNKTANMVMIGAFLKITGILSRETFSEALSAVISKKNKDLIPLNMQAFDKGAEYVTKLKQEVKAYEH